MARYKRGSTPKLNQELTGKISSAIRNGAYVESAAALCGISKDTLYRWLQAAEGRHSTPLLIEFLNSVKRAMTEAEMCDLGIAKKMTSVTFPKHPFTGKTES
jgi:hypothetical protein